MAHVWMTHTTSLLDTHFKTYQNESIKPTIMTLKEGIKRSVNLDQSTAANGIYTFDYDPNKVKKLTVAHMNWATYYDADSTATTQWTKYDLESYLKLLDAQLLTIDFFKAATNDQDALDEAEGKRFFAQIYYQAMYRGTMGVVEVDGSLAWVINHNVPENNFKPGFPTSTWRGTTYVTLTFIFSALQAIPGIKAAGFWASFKKAFTTNYYGFFANMAQFKGAKTKLFFAGAFTVATLLIVVGLALVAAGILFKNATLKQTGIIVLNVASIIILSLWLATLVHKLATAGIIFGAGFRALTGIAKAFNLFGGCTINLYNRDSRRIFNCGLGDGQNRSAGRSIIYDCGCLCGRTSHCWDYSLDHYHCTRLDWRDYWHLDLDHRCDSSAVWQSRYSGMAHQQYRQSAL